MAFKTFVAGNSLPAADMNTYLMPQSVIVCTSATRPATPNAGMTIWETDNNALKTYTTATTTWQPPWNLPWGRLGHVIITASQTGIGGETDLTGMAVTISTPANRILRIWASVRLDLTTAGDRAVLNIKEVATFLDNLRTSATAAGAQPVTVEGSALVVAPSSGSHTYKLSLTRIGSGTVDLTASAAEPSFLMVEDVGPSAAPA